MRGGWVWTVVVWVAVVWRGDVLGQAAPPLPAVKFSDRNRPVGVQNVEFSVIWDYTYTGNVSYVGFNKLYQRLVHDGKVILEQESAVSDDTGLVLVGKGAGFILDVRGWQTIDLFISYTPDFAVTKNATRQQWYVPGGVTLLPPLVVIFIAFATREVIYALYLGIFFATFIVEQYNPFAAFLTTLDKYIVQSIGDVGHAYVILFTWLLSALIAVISKSGGTFGIADVFQKFAKTRTSVQMVIFLLGFVIFFDSYANSLVLGNTMRLVSDRMMISREKLAFLVDATTSPIASIAPISSWIGFEVGLVQQQLDNLEANGVDISSLPSAYIIFIETIPSRFYPILMLWFQFTSILCRREWGPMLLAERRAHDEGKLSADDAKLRNEEEDKSLIPKPGTPERWWNGFVPIVLVVALVIIAIVFTGRTKTIQLQEEAIALGLPPPPLDAQNIFGNGDANASLTYASFAAVLFAWLMFRFQYALDGKVFIPWRSWIRCRAAPGSPLMTLEASLAVTIVGIKMIFDPLIVLILAWAVGASITDSGADIFFSSALGSGLDPRMLPTLTFIIAAIISFCTGTSWGTMTILFPLVVPASYNKVDPDDQRIFILTISAILAGSIFGDHCAPISDTTILAAIASGCDLMHHTITQAPYGVLAAMVSVLLGYLPVGYEAYPAWAGLVIGGFVMLLLVIFFGVRVDHPKRKLDVLTHVIEWIASKLHRHRGEGDGGGDFEGEKYVHVYNPDDELTYVDILRPKTFFNRASWRRQKPAAGDDKLEKPEDIKSHVTDDGTVSEPNTVEIVPAEIVIESQAEKDHNVQTQGW